MDFRFARGSAHADQHLFNHVTLADCYRLMQDNHEIEALIFMPPNSTVEFVELSRDAGKIVIDAHDRAGGFASIPPASLDVNGLDLLPCGEVVSYLPGVPFPVVE